MVESKISVIIKKINFYNKGSELIESQIKPLLNNLEQNEIDMLFLHTSNKEVYIDGMEFSLKLKDRDRFYWWVIKSSYNPDKSKEISVFNPLIPLGCMVDAKLCEI